MSQSGTAVEEIGSNRHMNGSKCSDSSDIEDIVERVEALMVRKAPQSDYVHGSGATSKRSILRTDSSQPKRSLDNEKCSIRPTKVAGGPQSLHLNPEIEKRGPFLSSFEDLNTPADDYGFFFLDTVTPLQKWGEEYHPFF